jgi:hypothetical protein
MKIISLVSAAIVALALALAACGSAPPPDYTSATTCAAKIVTGPNTSYLGPGCELARTAHRCPAVFTPIGLASAMAAGVTPAGHR